MVAPAQQQSRSADGQTRHGQPAPAWLAFKMAVYAAAFLAFILVGLPYAFHQLGLMAYPSRWNALLNPAGPIQRFVGAAVFCVGLGGYVFCSLWLVVVGKGPFVEFDPPREFVASGPYRWTRNPIAALLIVTVLGEAIYFGSPGILTLVALGIPLAQYQVTRIEEPRLRRRFGDAYADYCRRVPRWFPRPPGQA